MTKLRYTNVGVFIQCQYTKAILRNKNIGQSLFKIYSKSKNFKEILYFGMTRFRSVKLGGFKQFQTIKTNIKKKRMGRNRFKKLLTFQKVQLSNFNFT